MAGTLSGVSRPNLRDRLGPVIYQQLRKYQDRSSDERRDILIRRLDDALSALYDALLDDLHETLVRVESEIRAEVLRQVHDDPGTTLFGKSLAEIQRALLAQQAIGGEGNYRRGYRDAVETFKRLADQALEK